MIEWFLEVFLIFCSLAIFFALYLIVTNDKDR